MHPACVLIEALVDEELSPGNRAVGVEPVLARHLELRTEEEGGVRVDEKQSVMVSGVGGRDGHAVRAGWLRGIAVVYVGCLGERSTAIAGLDDRGFTVERFELL